MGSGIGSKFKGLLRFIRRKFHERVWVSISKQRGFRLRMESWRSSVIWICDFAVLFFLYFILVCCCYAVGVRILVKEKNRVV